MIRSRQFTFSKDAIRDLVNIYDFIAEKNPAAAVRVLRDLETKIESIAASGHAGV